MSNDFWSKRDSPGGLGYSFPLWNPDYVQIVVEGIYGTRYHHTSDMKSHGMPDLGLMVASEKIGNNYGRLIDPRSGRKNALGLVRFPGTFRGYDDYLEIIGKMERRWWIGNEADSLVLKGIDELLHIVSFDQRKGEFTLTHCHTR